MTKKWNYYNDVDPFVCEWARNLIKAGLVPDGEVDGRSITDVQPEDLKGFVQCHFFCGILGWSLALDLAGWPDDRPVWTGSCPCQPFSHAGKQQAQADPRHLWPVWFNLIRKCEPPVVFGEQVEAAIAKGWLDEVANDLEGERYRFASGVLPACSVTAPHRRNRLWFVADTGSERRQQESGSAFGYEEADGGAGWYELQPHGDNQSSGNVEGALANPNQQHDDSRRFESVADGGEQQGAAFLQGSQPKALGDPNLPRSQRRVILPERPYKRVTWTTSLDWWEGLDGKLRPIESGILPLAHGVSGRVGLLRSAGNAIVPEVAAEVIGAYMEATA